MRVGQAQLDSGALTPNRVAAGEFTIFAKTGSVTYKKAAALGENELTPGYLLKAALVCEETGDNASALKLYKEIESKYPQTVEGYDVQKYISRIENQK